MEANHAYVQKMFMLFVDDIHQIQDKSQTIPYFKANKVQWRLYNTFYCCLWFFKIFWCYINKKSISNKFNLKNIFY